MSARLLAGTVPLASAILLLWGCGGGDKEARPDTASTAAPAAPAPATTPAADTPAADTATPAAAPAPARTDTAKAAAKPAAKPPAGGAAGASPKLVALGDSIFHGQVAGGTCTACHGQDAKGTPVGPDLTDNEWLHSDGSLAGITKTITNGVPQPKKAPAPMPPKGGAALTDDQVKAVAAYEYSLSHK
jgi:mono/diheme cytochrome c family protein